LSFVSYLKIALDFHKLKNYNEAKKNYLLFLEKYPNSSMALHGIGVILFFEGKYEESIRFLQKASLFEEKENFKLYNNLSLSYLGLEDFDNALKSINRSLQLNPNYFEGFTNKAKIYLKIKDKENSIYNFTKALKLKDNAETYFNRGIAYYEFNDVKNAIIDFNKSTELDKNYHKSFLIKAVIFFDQKKYQDSINNFNKVNFNNFDQEKYFQFYGEALIYEKKFQDALNISKIALNKYPFSLGLILLRSLSLIELDEVKLAIEDLKFLIKKNPQELAYWENIAKAFELSYKINDFFALLKPIIKKIKDKSRLYYIISQSYFSINKLILAQKYINKSIHLNESFFKAIVLKSEILKKLGSHNKKKGYKLVEVCRFKNENQIHEIYNINYKYWNGEKKSFKNLLIWGEQGIGDEIFYSSYISNLFEMNFKNLFIEIDGRLIDLHTRYLKNLGYKNFKFFPSKRSFKSFQEAPFNEIKKEKFDLHIPIANLPIFCKDNFFISKNNFFYVPNPAIVNIYKKKVSSKKLKIGLAWSTTRHDEKFRNIPLIKLTDLLRIKEFNFYNLQWDDNIIHDANSFFEKNNINIKFFKDLDYRNDFNKLAGLISSLDIVITVQNTIAHLAGALGKKTFLLLSLRGRWMYQNKGSSVSEYPSIYILRQKKFGEWDEVIYELQEKLIKLKI